MGTRVSPATVHNSSVGQFHNGRGCRRSSSPSKAPRQRQQVLVHAFCRTVCMAIATLAAVNQFVFCLPACSLRAPTDIEIAAELLRALRNVSPALVSPERKLDGFKSRVSLPLLAGVCRVGLGLDRPGASDFPSATEVGGVEASLVSCGMKLLAVQGPIQHILPSKSRIQRIVYRQRAVSSGLATRCTSQARPKLSLLDDSTRVSQLIGV